MQSMHGREAGAPPVAPAKGRAICRSTLKLDLPMPTLFDPIAIGDLVLPNRILMAPLTRTRAGESRVPNALMAEYYLQRASAGLIITEGVPVTPMGVGY